MIILAPVFARQRRWGGSSVGRALRSQRRGREFESHSLHQFFRRRRSDSSLQPAGRKSGERRYSVCSGSEQWIKRRRASWGFFLIGLTVLLGRVHIMNGAGLKQPEPERGYQCLKRRHTKHRQNDARSRRTGKFSLEVPASAIWRAASRANVNAISAACRPCRCRSRSASRSCSRPNGRAGTLTKTQRR